jgi:Lrp/AsnC family leucine-responsive transcriptional regulator
VLDRRPDVLEPSLISGDYDDFIRSAVKNTKDYERMLREKLYKIPGIRTASRVSCCAR